MKRRLKIIFIILLTLTFIVSTYVQEKRGEQSIARDTWNYSPSFKQFLLDWQYKIKELTTKDEEVLPVSSDFVKEVTIINIKYLENGYFIAFDQPVSFIMPQNGFIFFTGNHNKTKKTMTIKLNDGKDLTIGMMQQFQHLPYSTVSIGEKIAVSNNNILYVQIKENGQLLSKEEIVEIVEQSVVYEKN